ncbi:MAG: 3-phosphoshikimate 1-carboxyvinyltransferase, partial [Francisellaceae bacterium]
DRENETARVIGSGGNYLSNVKVFARDAGTVSRFLLPACAALGGEYAFSASARMCERPMQPLLDILALQGIKFKFENMAGHLPLTFESSCLSGGTYNVSGSKSSQFLSGLLIASPYAKSTTLLNSDSTHLQPYVDMTANMMIEFGVSVDRVGNSYCIESGQAYSGRDYMLEPDVSTASYFWAVAALTEGKILVQNIKRDCLQGDIEFLNLLQKMGCKVVSNDDGIIVYGPKQLKSVKLNMRSYSDTFMTAAVLACFAEGETCLFGLSHTRLQESDRIECIAKGLRALGANVRTDADAIYVQPGIMRGAEVSGCNDHRIAMSLALVGIKVPGVIITGADCVKKTCPDYFERMKNIVR